MKLTGVEYVGKSVKIYSTLHQNYYVPRDNSDNGTTLFQQKNKAATSDFSKSLGLQMPTIDETFRNTAPSQPLNKASYRHSNDPVKRIGYQYQVSGVDCY